MTARLRQLRRFLRLWPGAYFTLPHRMPSVREVGWMIQDTYVPVVRAQLDASSPLLDRLRERT